MMWPLFWAFMWGSAGGDAVDTPLMLTSIIRSQSRTLPRSSGECGIRPALLKDHVDAPVGLHRAVDELLDLLVLRHVRLHGGFSAATARRQAPQASR